MKKYAPLLSLLLLLVATPVLAAEEGGSFFARNKTWIELAVSVINFAVFAWLLVHYGGPALKRHFANQAREYQEKVREANVLLADAQRLHAEWETRRQGLEDEARRIQQDVQRLAEAQAAEILENAKTQAARLIADAESTAANELVRTKDELRRELVEALLAKTEDRLHTRLDASNQRALIDEALRKLEATE
jgi:F-type H+-transporting ATPase subunit b